MAGFLKLTYAYPQSFTKPILGLGAVETTVATKGKCYCYFMLNKAKFN